MKVEASNLKKSYGSKVAIADISFEIRSGQTLGLLGPNGSGKSTTINIMTGKLSPDRGTVKYDGKTAVEYGEGFKDLIGVMPQEVIIWEHLSIEENLNFLGKMHGVAGKKLNDRIDYLVKKLQLEKELKTLARNLSGGFRRRLNLAISVIHDPKVIYLDEPTPGVDPQSRQAMWDFITELKAAGDYSILLTDHYLDEAEKACDYIIIVDNGQVVTSGTMKELKKEHGNGKLIQIDFADDLEFSSVNFEKFKDEILSKYKDAKLSDDHLTIPTKVPETDIVEVLNAVNYFDLSFDDISIKEPSLEDIFLLLTGKEVRS